MRFLEQGWHNIELNMWKFINKGNLLYNTRFSTLTRAPNSNSWNAHGLIFESVNYSSLPTIWIHEIPGNTSELGLWSSSNLICHLCDMFHLMYTYVRGFWHAHLSPIRKNAGFDIVKMNTLFMLMSQALQYHPIMAANGLMSTVPKLALEPAWQIPWDQGLC